MSKHTSFLAVEKRKEATQGTMKTYDSQRRGSLVNSQSYSDSDNEDLFDDDEDASSGSQSEDEMDFEEEEAEGAMDIDILMDFDEREVQSSASFSSGIKRKRNAPIMMIEEEMDNKKNSLSMARDTSSGSVNSNNNSNDTNTVRNVMKQQDFSGSFSLNTLQMVVPSVKSDLIAKFVKDHSLKNEAAVITLFVAVVFELKFAAQKSVWDLVMKKAKQWAKKQLGVADLTGIETEAKNVLQPLL